MKIEYSFDRLMEAFNNVQIAEQSDALPIYTWARYAKILADALERVDGITKNTRPQILSGFLLDFVN